MKRANTYTNPELIRSIRKAHTEVVKSKLLGARPPGRLVATLEALQAEAAKRKLTIILDLGNSDNVNEA